MEETEGKETKENVEDNMKSCKNISKSSCNSNYNTSYSKPTPSTSTTKKHQQPKGNLQYQ